MADLEFIKTDFGLAPATDEARSWFAKVKHGVLVLVKVTVPRNRRFHRKFFAMLHVAFDNHEWPTIETQYGPARCTFNLFRKYVTVRAGYFEMVATPKGEARAEAKSIAFGRMDETEFEQLYSAVLDVILAEFLTNWKSGDMDRAVDQMLGFA